MDRPAQEEASDVALHFRLADHGRAFATRERGEELRSLLTQQWMSSEPVVIELDGVSHVSYSFADEFFGKLFCEPGHAIQLIGANPGVARVSQRAVERRTGEAMPC